MVCNGQGECKREVVSSGGEGNGGKLAAEDRNWWAGVVEVFDDGDRAREDRKVLL